MAIVQQHKFVNALPAQLEANAIYYVRVRSGIDLYVTNASGTIVAYPTNQKMAPSRNLTETSYTLAATDVGAYLRFAAASNVTVQVPAGEFVLSEEVHIRRVGAGNLTLAPAAGVTINSGADGSRVLTAGMTVTLKKVGADEWDLIGQTVAP